MNNEVYILNELNKGIKMGMDSISTVSEKVGDKILKTIYFFSTKNTMIY